jgi:predicted O-methyltransferase YrrM
MLEEVNLFDNADRYVIDRSVIDAVALPMGDNYGDEIFTDYFCDYAGMAHKYKPKRIYEIGVRYGYTAICMLLGAHANRGAPKPEYIGVDDESYHPCVTKANENFATVVPWANARCIKWNSFDGVPTGVGTVDFIHVDGNHDYMGVANDLLNCWPILNPGGFILLDDAAQVDDHGYPGPIFSAIQDFLRQFKHSEERVQWMFHKNQRSHVYIKRL